MIVRPFRAFLILAAISAAGFLAAPVTAQPYIQAIPPTQQQPNTPQYNAPAPDVTYNEPDSVAIQSLKRRVKSLEQLTQNLDSRLRSLEGSRGLTFSCEGSSVSVSSNGEREDCGLYTCNRNDGRCRTSCNTTAHCTVMKGTSNACYVEESRCGPPPPPVPE